MPNSAFMDTGDNTPKHVSPDFSEDHPVLPTTVSTPPIHNTGDVDADSLAESTRPVNTPWRRLAHYRITGYTLDDLREVPFIYTMPVYRDPEDLVADSRAYAAMLLAVPAYRVFLTDIKRL